MLGAYGSPLPAPIMEAKVPPRFSQAERTPRPPENNSNAPAPHFDNRKGRTPVVIFAGEMRVSANHSFTLSAVGTSTEHKTPPFRNSLAHLRIQHVSYTSS